MSLVNNKSESERIQKMKDRMLYSNYLIAQAQYQSGCNPTPHAIQSGSGSSVLIDIRLGEQYTTVEESATILINNTCNTSTVPSPPTNLSAIPGDTEVSLSWTIPSSDGGSPIISYRVVSSPGEIISTSITNSVTVTGLTNLTSYTFIVVAINAKGSSINSVASAAVLPRVTLYSSDGDTLSGWIISATSPSVTNSFGNPLPSISLTGANKAFHRSVAASGQVNGTNTTYEFDAYIVTKRFWFKFGCDSAGANGPSLTFLSDTKNGLTESTGSWGYSAGFMTDTNITVSLNTWHRFKIQCATGTNNTVWYLDGVLQNNTYTYAGNGTYLGFIVDNGTAYVDNIVIYQGIV